MPNLRGKANWIRGVEVVKVLLKKGKKERDRIISLIQPRDIIALVSIIGCFMLKLKGADGMVSIVIAAIIGYYFSKRVSETGRSSQTT